MVRQCLAFFSGALAVALLLAVLRHGSPSVSDRDLDIALGKDLLQDAQVADTAADLVRSNQLGKAEVVLNGVAFTSLQEAWVISRRRDGVLDEKLNPLLLAVYPKVRGRLDWRLFEHWSTPMLMELTNFMFAADALARSKSE